MCDFNLLFFSDEGYVGRCKQCGHYQVAFMSTILTLTEPGFEQLRNVVSHKCTQAPCRVGNEEKCIVVPTPSQEIHLLLSKKETVQLHGMLEEADNENKALALIRLFNQ